MLPRCHVVVLALLLPGAAFAAPAASKTPARRMPTPDAIAQAAKDQSLQHYLNGILLEGQGDLHGAMGEIGRAFAYEPSAPDLALKLADLALNAGDGDAALDYARRSITLGDKTGRAHFIAGAALAGAGRP